MATVTQAGEAGDAALVVKGDGRVHGQTTLADWRKVDGVSMTIGNVDAIYTAMATDMSPFIYHRNFWSLTIVLSSYASLSYLHLFKV